jgi:lipid-A-disaccharide synthase
MEWLGRLRPETQFALSQANDDLGRAIATKIAANKQTTINKSLRLVATSDNYNLLSICDLVWAKSGTTTLEATLYGKPMLIFIRGDWPSYLIFLAFKRVRRLGWPNLLAGKELVPELIQLDCRAEQFVKYTQDLLDVPKLREEISKELLSLRDQLGQGDYANICAQEIAKAIKNQGLMARN